MAQTEPEVHPVQAHILRTLLFQPEARFSDLKDKESRMTNDHFTFHVQKLLDDGLVNKTSTGNYTLTAKGKEFANRFDTDKKVIERQAKLGVLLVCRRKKGDTWEYVVQQRLKQPFYGFHGSITGKIPWGETAYAAAARELMEETGLEADLTFAGIEHKMEYGEAGELLEDKYFYIFTGDNPRGEFMTEFEGGRNFWCTREACRNLPDLYQDVEDVYDLVERGKVEFFENQYTVQKY